MLALVNGLGCTITITITITITKGIEFLAGRYRLPLLTFGLTSV